MQLHCSDSIALKLTENRQSIHAVTPVGNHCTETRKLTNKRVATVQSTIVMDFTAIPVIFETWLLSDRKVNDRFTIMIGLHDL